jgi:hypothetical protein
MRFSVDILESDAEIQRKILTEITKQISLCFQRSIPSMTSEIKSVVSAAIKSEPEYSSLINGQLRKEFGIDDVTKVDLAIEYLLSTLNIINKGVAYSNSGISGGIKITLISNRDIDSVTENASFMINDVKGYSLPWLEWLLLRGTMMIVNDYSVKFGSYSRSRSGGAIMVASNGNWGVPAAFAGSEGSNWITRSLSKTENSITSIIKKNIERYI